MAKGFLLIFSMHFCELYSQQALTCNLKDSAACLSIVKYPGSEIILNKLLECETPIIVTKTPLLADMDHDCIPELLYQDNDNLAVLVFDSKSGALKYKIETYNICGHNGFAVADVNYDGYPEVFIVASFYFINPIQIQGKLICYDHLGNLQWISDERVDLNEKGETTRIFGSPGLADFNQDGIPEIYISNKIFNALTGNLLVQGVGDGIGLVDRNRFGLNRTISVAAQLDQNIGDLELAAGYTIYKVNISNTVGTIGNVMTPFNIMIDGNLYDGATTMGDINNDGFLDVIVSCPYTPGRTLLYVYNLINGVTNLLCNVSIANDLEISSPGFVGNIKGNGMPSILVTTNKTISSYSFDGSQFLLLDFDLATTDSSGATGIAFFDLNNNGFQEIIYRDQTHLKVIDGSISNPRVLATIECYSGTLFEQPIVGDLDNSGFAKLCVSCSTLGSNSISKLTIFGPPDSLPGWAPARGIWNQYNYHILNINDDLTVPRVQKNNATYKNGKYNNFNAQESLIDRNGMYLKRAASLTGKIKCINYDPKNNEYTVIFDVFNLSNASFNADSSLPVSFYNGDPATGGNLVGTYYTLINLESGDSLLNLEFKFTVTNLTDLFMVINTTRNGSGLFDPNDFSILECDYTDNIFRTVELPRIEKINASICKGDTYNFYDTLIDDAGTYYHILGAVNGCDSLIFNLELTTVDTIYTTQSIIDCDRYTWNGKTYSQSGSFIHDTINQFGCDSITTLDLVINHSDSLLLKHTACDSFTWNGNTYQQSGNYPFRTLNIRGCDSVITLDLIINNSQAQLIDHSACNTYSWNGNTYTQSGLYKFDTINQFGCDSSVLLDLTINSVINVTMKDIACDSYTWNGNTYTQSGTYQQKTINHQGCDSITTLQLAVNNSNSSFRDLVVCDSFNWNGFGYDQSGNYQYKTLNVFGCDSTANLHLTVNKSSSSLTWQSACDTYSWNGITFDTSGAYQYHTLNSAGCDSTALLNLIIYNSEHIDLSQTVCDRFNWNGIVYDKSGIYQFKTLNTSGCDSITNLNLTINTSTKADLALSVCDSLNFLGKTLKANGEYTFIVQNSLGCDSTINLQLNTRSELYNTAAINCDTFFWNQNGMAYSKSGIYFQKYINSFGCDSIYQLDLTIYEHYEHVQHANACNEYVWQVNNTLLRQSGEYLYPLKTILGCDSIIKLNLLLDYDFLKRDTVITEGAFTWPVNQQTYSTSGIYQEKFTSKEGCDSIHQLFLTIKNNIGIYYPNVIRPGGSNGWFSIFDNGRTISFIETLKIFDRWGELVWQKHGILPNELQMGWDGTFNGAKVLPGVYVWHAQLVLRDGSVIHEKGDVTVLR
ncbi:MAG: gliding motility-associated C-terminal domain-containing protein [Saprospiraceae bacterium]|nr:gliding motility-associated C-terminal domain-containing protein [Saprospiraceae bacterium]